MHKKLLGVFLMILAVGCDSPMEGEGGPDILGHYTFLPTAISPGDSATIELRGLIEIRAVHASGAFTGQTGLLGLCEPQGPPVFGCVYISTAPEITGEVEDSGEFRAVIFDPDRILIELTGTLRNGEMEGEWVTTYAPVQSGTFRALRWGAEM